MGLSSEECSLRMIFGENIRTPLVIWSGFDFSSRSRMEFLFSPATTSGHSDIAQDKFSRSSFRVDLSAVRSFRINLVVVRSG